MKKGFITVAVVGAVFATLSLGLGGCKKNNNINIVAKDVYAMSAVSGANYLKDLEGNVAKNLLTSSQTRPTHISNSDVSNIKCGIQMFDQIMINNGISQTTTKVLDNDEYFGTYNFVMKISLPNYGGTTSEYKMYYNETETKTNKEIEDENVEVEVSTNLVGIMLVDGLEFKVQGKREFEVEGNEKESSIEFKTISLENPNNYVVIKQEVENDEVEYEYEVYENGIKISETEFEIEKENNKTFVEMEFADAKLGKVEYKIKQTNVADKFSVEYKNGNVADFIIVQELADGFSFVYSNGFQEDVK